MKFVIASIKENFINDYKSGKLKSKQLVEKYKFASIHDFYMTVSNFRKEGLLPETTLSKSIKAYYKTKETNAVKTNNDVRTINDRSTPLADYRTVYFKDFTVQIHKKAMARLVVDHNNNLHILNS
jgi:hypothetical protein